MLKRDVKIGLNDFDSICRVCLIENDELESVYGVTIETTGENEQVDLVKIFKRYCNVEVSPHDDKPQHICKTCIRFLRESYAFFDKCSQSNQILDRILFENKFNAPTKSKGSDIDTETDHLKIKPLKIVDSNFETYGFTESEDDALVNEHGNDSDWELPKREVRQSASLQMGKPVEQKDNAEYPSDQEKRIKAEKQGGRKIKEAEQNNPLKKRGRPRKRQIVENRNDAEDSEAIANQHKELICRLCNESFPDINTSIDHYDDIHAPKMEVDKCIFCDKPKIYKKRDNLLYHMGLHAKDSIKCIPCRKFFRTKELLTEHLNECFKCDSKTGIKIEDFLEATDIKPEIVAHPTLTPQLSQKVLKMTQYDGAFTCQLCNQHLGEIDFVISHYEKDHLNDLLCILCLRAFSKQVPLFHLGLHSKKSYVCRPCRLFFRTKEDYNDHYAKYDHDKSLACKICGKKFTRNYKKKIESQQKHKMEKSRSAELPPQKVNKHMLSHLKEKNYSCNKCGKTFTYKTSLVRHFKMHFGKRFLCSSCGNAYTTKFMLQRHIRIMHTYVDEDGKPLPKPPPKPVKLQCEFCGEIFTTKYGYGRHIRRHPEFKEFKCKICSFMCDTRDQLELHMENRHNKHTCDVCGKRFPFESELKTHHRKHEDMEMARFRCDVCGKTARTQTQLKVHYRIHTGERPFSCETCGKSFKQTAHLKVHMFQHTGKMPFKCEICEKSFPFQHVMEIHMRTHTGEKPFQCMFCGNAYHDRTTMQKHQKKKHPDMPVQKVGRGDYKISKLP